jgi:FkbM family methyltransferase
MPTLARFKSVLPRPIRARIGRIIRRRRKYRDPLDYGFDFITEIKTRLPHLRVRTVLDVGAWHGITALEFSDHFPAATVHAFEPSIPNFVAMQKNLVGKTTVAMHQKAIGTVRGLGHIEINPENDSMGRVLARATEITQPTSIETIDQFCSEASIEFVDILKIDVEGRELDVLAGAASMLKREKIGIIELECTTDPDNTWQTSFFDICERLHPLGYRLFGIYEQHEYWQPPAPRLRRVDAAFISRPLYSVKP